MKKKHTGSNRPETVVYARVSSKEQEKEGYSIPAQLKLLITQAIKLFPPSSTETPKKLIFGFAGMGTIN